MERRVSGSDAREIERVWVLRAKPMIPHDQETIARVEIWDIEQGYLAPPSANEQSLARSGYPEGRLRRVTEPDGTQRYFHTVKSGTGLVRIEHERILTRAEFEALWPRTLGRRLAKMRHRVHEHGGLIWEIDVFRDLPLVLAEVELASESQDVPMPVWISQEVIREVTMNPRYRNFALATIGLPSESIERED
jgi:CYTH domain-containing protein